MCILLSFIKIVSQVTDTKTDADFFRNHLSK